MNKKRSTSNFNKTKEPEHVLVYSTDPRPPKDCLQCSKPLAQCDCDLSKIKAFGSIKPTLSLEKKGRGGKVVTVLSRLPAHQALLKELCVYLKNAIGAGGTHYIEDGEGIVEIQGDRSKNLVELAQNYFKK